MSDLSLSQILAVLQDNIQRSYEHAETLAALDREGDAEKITMALDHVEVEVPVVAAFSEEKVAPGLKFEEVEGLSAYELSALRVDLPSSTPALRRAVQDQIALVNARDQVKLAKAEEIGEVRDGPKRLEKEMEPIDREIASTREATKAELSTASSQARNVRFRTIADESDFARLGKLTVKFKAVIK